MDITGIKILYSEPIMRTMYQPIIILVLVVGYVLCLAAVMLWIFEHRKNAMAAGIPGVIFLVVGILIASSSYEIETGKYKYYCEITDNVDLVRVADKYEIVEQKGKFIVLRER